MSPSLLVVLAIALYVYQICAWAFAFDGNWKKAANVAGAGTAAAIVVVLAASAVLR